MTLAPRSILLTPDEYLKQEKTAESKHEFDNGVVFAMVGASRSHNLIALTLATEIRTHLKNSHCRTYISDMKLRIRTLESDKFYYPDVMVSCDEEPPSEYYEDKPILVIEVLSSSTETRDKLEKLAAYGRVKSLQEYLTVAQDRVEVNRYSWLNENTMLTQYRDGDIVNLGSIGLNISVKDIYQDVAGKILSDH